MQGTYLGGYPWKDFGILTAADLNAAIAITGSLSASAVQRSGDTMTGPLLVNANTITVAPALLSGTLLHLTGADGGLTRLQMDAFGANAASNIEMRQSGGTGLNPTRTLAGNTIGGLSYRGYYQSATGAQGYAPTNNATINAVATDNYTDTAQGAQLHFATMATGSNQLIDRLVIGQGLVVGAPGGSPSTGGNMGLGTLNAQGLYINGAAVGAATGALPIGGGTLTGPLIVNLNTAPAQAPMAGTNLQLSGTDGAVTRLEVDAYNNGVFGASANITLRAAHGTAATPTSLLNGDIIGGVVWRGYNTTIPGYSAGNRATFFAFASENWGAAPAGEGTQLQFATTATGSTTLTTRLTIAQGLIVGAPSGGTGGNMGQGTLNAQGLFVNGVAVTPGGLSGAVPLTGGTMSGTLGVNLNAANLAPTTLGMPLIHTAGADNTPALVVLDAYTNSVGAPSVNFRTAAGSGVNPATVSPTVAANLGALRFYGYDATTGSFESAGAAAVFRAIVNGPWSSTSHPTRFEFGTTAPGSVTYPAAPLTMVLAQGLVVGGPSGGAAGDMGFGSINAQAIYLNGVAVGSSNSVSRSGDTMSGPLVINANAAPVQPALSETLLQLSGVDNALPRLQIDAFGTLPGTSLGAAPNLSLRAARGTGAFPSATLLNDVIGGLNYRGYGATGWAGGNNATINVVASENFSDTAQGVHLVVSTTAPLTTILTPRWTVGQGVQIGAPTGGDLGPGTINATGIFINNQPVGTSTGGTPPGGTAGQAQYNLGGTAFGGSPALILSSTAVTTLNVGGDLPGDIYFRSATGFTRLGIGGVGNVLTVSAGLLPSWGVAAAGGTITAVNPGVGLTGGGTSGSVTLAVSTVPVANGGTGATAAGATAATNIGALPLAGGTISGAPGSLVIGTPLDGSLGTGTLSTSGMIAVNGNTASAPAIVAGALLHLTGANNAIARLQIDALAGTNSLNAPSITLRQARGTAGTGNQSATQSGDYLGNFNYRGYGLTGYTGGSVNLYAVALENFTDGAQGAQLVVSTITPTTTSLVQRLAIGPGVVVGATTTGGDMGAGTVNATGLFVGGVAVGTPGTPTGSAQWNNAGAFAGSTGLTLSATAVTGMTMALGTDGTGDIYYRASSGSLTRLAIGGTAGQVLAVSAGALPAWQGGYVTAPVSLTTQVSGTLPVANGGTGAATLALYNVLLGNGTGIVAAAAPGVLNTVLASGGAGVNPSFQTLTAIGAVTGGPYLPTAGGTVSGSLMLGAPPDGSLGAGTLDMTGILQSNFSGVAAPAPGVTAGATYVARHIGPSASQPRILMDGYGAPSTIALRRTDGVPGTTAPLSLAANEVIGRIEWFGYAGGYNASPGAFIIGRAAEAWSATAQGMWLEFATTTANNATVGALTRMIIGANGGVVIGTPAGGVAGDMGPGTINVQAGGLYVNGVAVTVP
jgi:hypothetical protein